MTEEIAGTAMVRTAKRGG
jgi:hypothetical protein